MFDAGDSVVVCVNNLGALSSLEMAVITRATINSLGNFSLIFLKHHKHPDTFFVVVARIYYYLICASFANREPRHGGCQGNVRIFHDITGDGRIFNKPDEGKSRNTATVW